MSIFPKINFLAAFILLTCITLVKAQTILKGTVTEGKTNIKLSDVFIRDNANKQLTLSDQKGNFSIKTEVGHIIIFDSPGYVSDTLYVTDMSNKSIALETKSIALREVTINSNRPSFDPKKEYPDVYTKSKVYVLSPTTWFGKDASDARKLKKYFARDERERKIDGAFNRTYVSSLIPLKGQQLDDFMTLYRPPYALVAGNTGGSLAVYINDSYKKYQALPADKRQQQRLTSQ